MFKHVILKSNVLYLVAFRHTWETWIGDIFGIEEKELGKVVLTFFMNVRIILVFIILSPAIALHWMIKKEK